ncbi:MAG: D-alanyl-D-alanine carboxypeptidase family protein [Acidimicrobiia bacterium]|nr:D-alanyl-D-alanine carboxypeptidase family protein [Acidimicrobiia bacterium]
MASEVDAAEATSAELAEALAALDANVRLETSQLEEAEAAVVAAEADVARALDAQAATEAEIEDLRESMAVVAVNAYVSPPQQDTLQVMLDGDLGTAPERRALLDLRASDTADLLERFRSAQEDLAIQSENARLAEERAQGSRAEVQERFDSVAAAREAQAELTAEAQVRLDQLMHSQAELEESEQQISAELKGRQEEQLAALQRQIAEANARRGPVSLPGGGSVNLARVGGITVNASIAGQVDAMLQAAAADGIVLGGGGYRDSSSQIRLRTVNGCPDVWHASASRCRVPTAIPGTSMHEKGLAIDFTANGRSISSRGSAGFQWLDANAHRYGFKNLPSEPWHWSTSGG